MAEATRAPATHVTTLHKRRIEARWQIRNIHVFLNHMINYDITAPLKTAPGFQSDTRNGWQMESSLFSKPSTTRDRYGNPMHNPSILGIGIEVKITPLWHDHGKVATYKGPQFIKVSIIDSFDSPALESNMTKNPPGGKLIGETWSLKSDEFNLDSLTNNKRSYLPNDTLTLQFDMSHLEATHMAKEDPTIDHTKKEAETSPLLGFLRDDRYVDLNLTLDDGTQIGVHRVILAHQSPVLMKMFDEAESGNISLSGVTKTLAEAFIQHFYQGVQQWDFETARGLLKLADCFQVVRLKEACEATLIDKLTASTTAQVLIAADEAHADRLKAAALDFLVVHFRDVSATPTWRAALQSHPQLVIETIGALFGKMASP